MSKKAVVIGAGPVGLEAALAARREGWETVVLEQGEAGDSVRKWGHVKMFSPFSMNVSREGLAAVQAGGAAVPAPEALLTGSEYVEAYLAPLAAHLGVQTRTRVKAVARQSAGKRDKIGEPGRADTPFQLLVEKDGREGYEKADLVFDCSGTFQNPAPLGDAGLPALGETASRDRVSYGMGEAAGLERFAGLRLLVVGGGHSAAGTIVGLGEVKAGHPATQITWVVNKSRPAPMPRVPGDPLEERDRVCSAANALVVSGSVDFIDGAPVEALHPDGRGLVVTLAHRDGQRKELTVDHVFCATGFRPDLTLTRELHVQTCWATEGTYPLAASLLGETGGDCLAVAGFGAETLLHPEPGFYTLGMKSYGRTPDFLIRTGLEQVESLMEWLRKK